MIKLLKPNKLIRSKFIDFSIYTILTYSSTAYYKFNTGPFHRYHIMIVVMMYGIG
jgi:hypothetical protein